MKPQGASARAALVCTVCAMAVSLCSVRAAEPPPTPAAIPPGLSLARIFNHHMVLQRGRPIKVWGWADEGQQITVTFAGQTKSATAGADRSWTVQLDPLHASFEGRELTVTSSGGASVALKDILVGEVWLCGGQSNMSFPLWVRSDRFVKEDADKFLAEVPAQFTLAFDAKGDSAKRFDVKTMPSSYLIGRDGTVVATHKGFKEVDRKDLEARIAQALASK